MCFAASQTLAEIILFAIGIPFRIQTIAQYPEPLRRIFSYTEYMFWMSMPIFQYLGYHFPANPSVARYLWCHIIIQPFFINMLVATMASGPVIWNETVQRTIFTANCKIIFISAILQFTRLIPPYDVGCNDIFCSLNGNMEPRCLLPPEVPHMTWSIPTNNRFPAIPTTVAYYATTAFLMPMNLSFIYSLFWTSQFAAAKILLKIYYSNTMERMVENSVAASIWCVAGTALFLFICMREWWIMRRSKY